MLPRSVLLLLVVFVIAGCTQQSETNEQQTRTTNEESQTDAESTPVDESDAAEITKAVCKLESIGNSGVTGTIHFDKEGDAVHVHGELTGLSPGKHGFHVHESGDLSDKETGKSAGGHFNPTDDPHGRPSDEERHVGDLGNIEANEQGTAVVDMEDAVIQLNGPNSIVGRAVVVHAQEDKFTQPTGDAGDRVAFGVIEAAED